MSFSPNGTRFALACRRFIELWDTAKGTELTTLRGHTAAVTRVRFSPDGTRIASESDDTTVKLWDTVTGAELTTLKGHTAAYYSVSFSPDGTRIGTEKWGDTVQLWDTATGEEITSSVNSVSFSEVGSRMLSMALGLDGEQMSDDVSTGNLLPGEYGGSGGSDRSPDGRWLAVPEGNNVLLVDLTYKNTPNERRRRESLARPKARWHREQSLAAQSAKQWFASMFHQAWLLKVNPADAWAYDDLHEAHRKLLASNNGQEPSVPTIVSEMLQLSRGSELPQLTEESLHSLNSEIWYLVITPAVDESAKVSMWHAQRMQDVSSRFPRVSYFNTLGAIQYRLGQYEAAIETLSKSLETKASETEPSGPHPVALAFLTLCHHHAGHTDEAAQFRAQLNETMKNEMWVLNPELQTILVEVQSVVDGPEAVQPAGTPDDFNQEGGFEELSQHRWRFGPHADDATPYAISGENPHSGKTCLRIQSNYNAVMAHQTITVTPNTTYRLTGWIRTQIEAPAAAEPQPEADAAASEPADPPVPVTGACFGIVDREDVSESMTGTSDWKQITWEFNSVDEPTFWRRLGHECPSYINRAWR